MLITDYLVGRDENEQFLSLVVKGVLPTDCTAGRCHLVRRMSRQDLVQEFVQDGVQVDWIMFPDLPDDVAKLLEEGVAVRIIDKDDDSEIECLIPAEERALQRKVM